MEAPRCESRELLMFLGGNPDTSGFADTPHEASLEITARGGRKGEQRIFYVCEHCAAQLSWLHQHLEGWIEDCETYTPPPIDPETFAAPADAVGPEGSL